MLTIKVQGHLTKLSLLLVKCYGTCGRGMQAPDYAFRGHSNPVNCVHFFDFNRLILSGDSTGSLKIWEICSRRCLATVVAHDDSILSLCALNKSNFVSSSKDGKIKIWDLDIKPRIYSTSLESGSVGFCNIAVDSNNHQSRWNTTIFSPSSDSSTAMLWDVRESQKPAKILRTSSVLSKNHGMITALRFHSNFSHPLLSGPTLLCGFEDGSLVFFDLRTFQHLGSLKHHSEPLLTIDISPTSSSFITGGADSLLNSYTSQNSANEVEDIGEPKSDFLQRSHHQILRSPGTGSLSYRSDGRVVVSAHWDGTARLWAAKKLKPLAVLRHHRESVFGTAFGGCDDSSEGAGKSPINLGLFATASKDCTVAVWSTLADSLRLNPDTSIGSSTLEDMKVT